MHNLEDKVIDTNDLKEICLNSINIRLKEEEEKENKSSYISNIDENYTPSLSPLTPSFSSTEKNENCKIKRSNDKTKKKKKKKKSSKNENNCDKSLQFSTPRGSNESQHFVRVTPKSRFYEQSQEENMLIEKNNDSDARLLTADLNTPNKFSNSFVNNDCETHKKTNETLEFSSILPTKQKKKPKNSTNKKTIKKMKKSVFD